MNSQICMLYLKCMLYSLVLETHERSPATAADVHVYKASFKLRRKCSKRLDMAAQLREEEMISDLEFQELREVDASYRREVLFDELDGLRDALTFIGYDLSSILSFLKNQTITTSKSSVGVINVFSSNKLFGQVVMRLLEIADQDPDLIDFYWLQIFHIYVQFSKVFTMSSIYKVDLLQQALLAISLKYPHLSLRLAWSVLAVVGDYKDGRASSGQYASCILLLLQLEVQIYGTSSSLTGISHSSTASASTHDSVLRGLLQAAVHQKQDIAVDLYTLMRIRMRLSQLRRDEETLRMPQSAPLVVTTSGDYLRKRVDAPSSRDESHKHEDEDQDKSVRDKDNSVRDKDNSVRDKEEVLSTFSPASDRPSLSRGPDHAPVFSCVGIFQQIGHQPDVCAASNSPDGDLQGGRGGQGGGSSLFHTETDTRDSQHSDIVITSSHPSKRAEHDLSACSLPGAPGGVWKGLSHQLDFLRGLTDMVDGLRFVDRAVRTERLKTELAKYCPPHPLSSTLGYDPIKSSDDPIYRVRAIVAQDCRVFRTKARAPSMILCITELANDIVAPSGNPPHVAEKPDLQAPPLHKSHLLPSAPSGSLKNQIDSDSIEEMVKGRIGQTVAELHLAQRSRTASESSNVGGEGEGGGEGEEINHKSGYQNRPSHEGDDGDNTVRQKNLSRAHSSRRLGNSNAAAGILASARSSELLSRMEDVELQLLAESGRTLTLGRGRSQEVEDADASPPEGAPPQAPTAKNNNSGARSTGALSSEGEMDEDGALTLDPLLAEGLPIEDFEVTQKVMSSAMNLLRLGKISQQEYNELVKSDVKYRDEAVVHEDQQFHIKVKKYFGEYWGDKKTRLLQKHRSDIEAEAEAEAANKGARPDKSSQSNGGSIGSIGGKGVGPLDLSVFIVKSNDDLRQEVFCLQIMELCMEIFEENGLGNLLFLKPYRIISTSSTTGYVQVLPNTMSLDALKKVEGFVSLPAFFEQLFGSSVQRLHTARMNFVTSMAAYSLLCYILQIKDRHNGNILLDRDGHVLHIDFGFLLGIAPGGNFSIESAPFKLTEEMLEVIGGLDSSYFGVFVKAFSSGFLALRAKSSLIVSALELVSQDSTFPCLHGKDTAAIVDRLRARFRNELSIAESIDFCLDLITQSYSNLGTRQYDTFQWYSNGIVP